jgi:hypothetical protein
VNPGLSPQIRPPLQERQEPRLPVSQESDHLPELLLPTDERRRLFREVRLVERLERREFARAELVEPLRGGQVLEPVLSEIK